MGVCVTDRGFKRTLTQLTGRYNKILIHLYILLNHARFTEPFSTTFAFALTRVTWEKTRIGFVAFPSQTTAATCACFVCFHCPRVTRDHDR